MNELTKVKNWEVVENPNGLEGVWVTGEEIGRRLEYSSPRVAINKIFNRNQNFFKKDKDYAEVSLVSPSGTQKTRVFSQKGCVKVARYSRQPLADEVMDQVIDFFFEGKPKDVMEQRFGHMPLFQVMKSCLENSEELKRQNDILMGHDQKIGVIETKVEHISDDRYWCVAGYAKCLNKKLTKDDISFITFEAKRQSSHMGYRLKFKPHDQYGKINRYHEEALIAAFDAWEKYVHNGQMELFG